MRSDALRAEPWITRQLTRTREPAGPVMETVFSRQFSGIFSSGMRRTQSPSSSYIERSDSLWLPLTA